MVIYFNQKVEIMKNLKTSIKIKLFLLLTIQTDGQSKNHRMALILRRNEAERKNTAQN